MHDRRVASPPSADSADVLVVGAGLSGLQAARRVTASGASVLVLEARDRVGGRTLSVDAGGPVVDLGAQFLGPGQDRLHALVAELGLSTTPTPCTGRKVLDLGGRLSSYEGDIPSMSIGKLIGLHLAIRRIEKLAVAVPHDRPWEAPRAGEWDALTVEAWERRAVPSRDVRRLLDGVLRVLFGAEAGELSFLHFLGFLSAGGGLMHLCTTEGGAQQDRVVGGSQQLARGLARPLADRLVKGAPVRRLVQDGDGVRAHTDRGEFRARRAVVAVPPLLAGRIDYEPRMPAAREHLTQRAPMGSLAKLVAVYDTPFWRDRGFSGEVVSDGAPFCVVLDGTAVGDDTAHLVGFVGGRHCRAWGQRPREERWAAALAALERYFGPEAAHPLAVVEQDWSSEPWTRGCPVGLLPPGTLTGFGRALRGPVGRIHWAGTETAGRWNGYMEGALAAGERAALEVLERL